MSDEDKTVPSELVGVGLRTEPVVQAPLVEAFNITHFREIANGATPIPSGTFSTMESSLKKNPREFGVVVYDDSMQSFDSGYLRIGDVAVINPDITGQIDNIVIAIVPERGRVLIRQLKASAIDDHGNAYVSLAAYTRKLPSLETYPSGEGGLQIVGVVIASSRSY